MHAPGTTGFRPAFEPHFLQHRLDLESDLPHVRPTHARPGIEVDAELVRVIEFVYAYRMRMKFNATEVDDPRETGGVIHNKFIRGTARRKRQSDCRKPCRPHGRRPLLIKRFAFGTVDETFEHDRTILNSLQRARGDRKIVVNKVEFRKLDFL